MQKIRAYHKLIYNFGPSFSSTRRVSSIQLRGQKKREVEGSKREGGHMFNLSSGPDAGRRSVHRLP